MRFMDEVRDDRFGADTQADTQHIAGNQLKRFDRRLKRRSGRRVLVSDYDDGLPL